MRLLNKITPFLFAAVIVIFGAGLLRLFDLVFERGDMYPSYSSLRSDPMGQRALFEAMKTMEGISVTRNFDSLRRLPEGRNTTLLICGSNLSRDPEDLVKALEDFVAVGGRLVITFFPLMGSEASVSDGGNECGSCGSGAPGSNGGDSGKDDASKKRSPEKCEKDEAVPAPWAVKMVSIEDRWGFTYCAFRPPTEHDETLKLTAEKRSGPAQWPPALSWHSTLYFDNLAKPWNVVYAREDLPVIVERPWFNGSIVLCSDSYFLSNEAMRSERHPELISWLVGSSTAVLFDERHFGLEQHKSAMALARAYHLERPLLVLLALALLFIWKNVFSLVPKRLSFAGENNHRGKDSTAGLINLLRRSIPARKILQVCVEEWEHSHDSRQAGKQEKVKEILDREASRPARQRDPVHSYLNITAVLTERDETWKPTGKMSNT